MSKSREHQSLNKMFRTGLRLEFQVDTYYGLNPTPQSPILILILSITTKKQLQSTLQGGN